jgi:hypothetical protein
MLSKKIQAVLSTHASLRAKDIVKEISKKYNISIDKSEINSCLYKEEGKLFIRDEEFKWSLVNPAPPKILEKTIGLLKEIKDPLWGKTNNRGWKKQDIIITANVNGQEIIMSSWNDQPDLSVYKPGEELEVEYEIVSKPNKLGTIKEYKILKHLRVLQKKTDDLPF